MFSSVLYLRGLRANVRPCCVADKELLHSPTYSGSHPEGPSYRTYTKQLNMSILIVTAIVAILLYVFNVFVDLGEANKHKRVINGVVFILLLIWVVYHSYPIRF